MTEQASEAVVALKRLSVRTKGMKLPDKEFLKIQKQIDKLIVKYGDTPKHDAPEQTVSELDKQDIISSVANDYYDSLKNESKLLNMSFEESREYVRKLATEDVEALILSHQTQLLERIYENSKYAEDRTAKEVQDRIEGELERLKQ